MSCYNQSPFEQVKENLKVFVENMNFLDSVSKIPELIEEINKLDDAEKEVCMQIVEAAMISLSETLQARGHKWD